MSYKNQKTYLKDQKLGYYSEKLQQKKMKVNEITEYRTKIFILNIFKRFEKIFLDIQFDFS